MVGHLVLLESAGEPRDPVLCPRRSCARIQPHNFLRPRLRAHVIRNHASSLLSFINLRYYGLSAMGQTGIEPATYRIFYRCSASLSYCPILCRAVTTPGTAGLSRLPSEVISSALPSLRLHPAKTCIRRGAGDGNRTRVTSLEDWCSAIELHRHMPSPPARWLTFKGCQL